ncbi:CBO0543 family protein [Bacillus dakarensis]|uniref:CBO0543 family protein n=1 Tax=Robertmurraya dakarensis TaxID=1926278 RepID=UPI00301BD654
MNTVKQLKKSKSQETLKKSYLIEFLPEILLATLLGTYLDLYFVGKGQYAFPMRPLPEIFSINITFTLISLPLLVYFILLLCRNFPAWKKAIVIIVSSVFMAFFEKLGEAFGFFIHEDSWKHWYSLVGYSLFFAVIFSFHSIRKKHLS